MSNFFLSKKCFFLVSSFRSIKILGSVVLTRANPFSQDLTSVTIHFYDHCHKELFLCSQSDFSVLNATVTS